MGKLGFGLGAALLVASACSHGQGSTRNDNYGNQAVATQQSSTTTTTTPPPDQNTAAQPQDQNAGGGMAANPSDQNAGMNSGLNSNAPPDQGNTWNQGAQGTAGNPGGTTNPNDTSGQAAGGTAGGTGGDTTGNPPPPEAATGGTTGTMGGAQDKNAIIASADGSQPGVVQNYANGTLTLATQGKKANHAGKVRTLTIGENVPVFQGNTRVSTDELRPGVDVRVYYRNPEAGSNQRQVIGVDILGGGTGSQNPGGSQGTGTSE
jgi:hypothetical protein